MRNFEIDFTVPFYLRKITNPSQQCICNTRSAAAPAGNFNSSVIFNFDAENFCRAIKDFSGAA